MKIDWVGILMLVAAVASCVFVILCARWYFNAIMATNWPDWIKWLLLRGKA